MATEEERIEEIKKAFFEYAKENELSAFDTSGYFARRILPNESFYLKVKVIEGLMESGVMVMMGEKWIIKDMETSS